MFWIGVLLEVVFINRFWLIGCNFVGLIKFEIFICLSIWGLVLLCIDMLILLFCEIVICCVFLGIVIFGCKRKLVLDVIIWFWLFNENWLFWEYVMVLLGCNILKYLCFWIDIFKVFLVVNKFFWVWVFWVVIILEFEFNIKFDGSLVFVEEWLSGWFMFW